ncbi:MAG: hypothetical protein QOH24_2084 [Verrucomicrobiota bacterium]|jgi:hypothetical protein
MFLAWQRFERPDIGRLSCVTERKWVVELELWLQEGFSDTCAAIGERTPLAGLRISPPLTEWEAKYFLLGWEENLFGMEEGHIQSQLLPPPSETDGRQKSYRIFSPEPPPRLLRENICQLAAASFLIVERGWLKRHVALEPSRKEHCSTAQGVDLLVRSAPGKILIWVEVKRSAVELEKLIGDLRACSRRGSHAHEDCGFPQNHPRYEFCVCYQPTYLWAVAPDAEICFEMKCKQSSIELEQLPSLPPRSLIESN